MSLQYTTLDVFTKTLFAGNPLGVVFLPASSTLSQTQKQIIAKEFNYSETIFVHPTDPQSPNQQRIDIFTTDKELPFAGHPTIGAASLALYLSRGAAASAASTDNKVDTLVTRAGPIPISLKPSGDEVGALIPHNVRIHQRRFSLQELLRLHPSLKPHVSAQQVTESFPVVSIVKGMTQVHVQLPSLEALAAVGPATEGGLVSGADASQGGYLDEGWGGIGLVMLYFYVRDVADESTGKTVIRTRMWLGSEEDPATGSAASGLAAYLALEEASKGVQAERRYDIVQGVEMGRRSDIGIRIATKLDGAPRIEYLELTGSAVKVAEGQLRYN
jgi:predicted PhzF superfamily epimerase YddE/YHI9